MAASPPVNHITRLVLIMIDYCNTHSRAVNSSVRNVISKGLKRGSQGGRGKSPDEFHLKVCGRDEYLDK